MNLIYPTRQTFLETLQNQPSQSLNFLLMITGSLNESPEILERCLTESVRSLKDGGVLFVQGLPRHLPDIGVFLEKHLTFKYWIAVESEVQETEALPTVHAGVLLFMKGHGRFNIKRTRLPHQYCTACGLTLKDWGGKSHLMNPDGYVVSDVVKDLPPTDNYHQLSKPLFELLLEMLDFTNKEQPTNTQSLIHEEKVPLTGLVGPLEGLAWKHAAIREKPIQYTFPFVDTPKLNGHQSYARINPEKMFDVVHHGDSLEILKQYPDESIDLVFADPPYNLDKSYNVYDDEQADHHYIEWCNQWLQEYIRILKPTGSLFVLNLPRWSMHHAHFLNKQLYFQNWIVWDALSEPRGKLMPAHYALLYYTKHPTNFTFNYEPVSQIDARHYCLRASCISQRKQRGDDEKTAVTDIWWNIHRIKHRRDRDHHPCQLPDALMERIIKLATNPGDVVLDAFGGVGTTPVVALQLGRHYVAMDLDNTYVDIMRQKISVIEQQGYINRQSTKQPLRVTTKKELQLELRQLAQELGRLPTHEDVKEYSQYDLGLFLETFPTWGKALKAAKLEVK